MNINQNEIISFFTAAATLAGIHCSSEQIEYEFLSMPHSSPNNLH
jgi:hypothetical protein